MSANDDPVSAQHEDFIESGSSEPRTTNPFAHSSNIAVSVPETVEIRLVDASVLWDYEIWSFFTSLLITIFAGFLVAWIQAPPETETLLSLVTALFGILALATGSIAVRKRHALSHKTRKLRYGVGERITPDESEN